MPRFSQVAALLAAGLLSACVTERASMFTMAPAPVLMGMTKAEVEGDFGKPLRVEKQANGGERWFYNFGSQRREATSSTSSESSAGKSSVSHESSRTTTTVMREDTIAFSHFGHVIEPIPAGKVILQ